MGVAPPPQEDAYLKARVDKMLAQLTVSGAGGEWFRDLWV
jgi:hypothetical protein